MGIRNYNTEEERKAAHREACKRYRERHKEELAAKQAEYYKNNREEILVKQAEYNAIHKEERKTYGAAYRAAHNEEKAAYMTEYNAARKEERKVYDAAYYQNNKTEIRAKQAAYNATPFGRASHLVRTYRNSDKKYNRGECTVTPQWIVDNVFTQPCHYCCETDWRKLGCDRKDSSLPHTPENCVPCCKTCNEKKNITPYDVFMRRIGKIA